jgi:hypothetical protein
VAKESKKKQSGVFTHYFAEGIINGMAATADGTVTANSIHDYVSKRIKEEEKNIETPKYNVKNKYDEFRIRTKTRNVADIFKEIRSFVFVLNDEKLISLDDASKVLQNCFGSADSPRKLEEKFVQNVYLYRDKKIDFNEFRRIQKLKLQTPKSRKVWLFILLAAFLLLMIIVIAANI